MGLPSRTLRELRWKMTNDLYVSDNARGLKVISRTKRELSDLREKSSLELDTRLSLRYSSIKPFKCYMYVYVCGVTW